MAIEGNDVAAQTGTSAETGRRAPGVMRGYLELLRLPNWFTAVADVVMGYLVMQAGTPPRAGLELPLLVGTSLGALLRWGRNEARFPRTLGTVTVLACVFTAAFGALRIPQVDQRAMAAPLALRPARYS